MTYTRQNFAHAAEILSRIDDPLVRADQVSRWCSEFSLGNAWFDKERFRGQVEFLGKVRKDRDGQRDQPFPEKDTASSRTGTA